MVVLGLSLIRLKVRLESGLALKFGSGKTGSGSGFDRRRGRFGKGGSFAFVADEKLGKAYRFDWLYDCRSH